MNGLDYALQFIPEQLDDRTVGEPLKEAELPPSPRNFWQNIVHNVMEPTMFDAGTALNMGGEALTLGLVGDEAAAGFDTMIGRGDGYDERLAHYRGNEEKMWEENPGAAIGTQLLPALIPGAGALNAAGKVPTLAGRALASAGLAGAGGATYGFMEGEGGKDERGQNALEAGTLSALIGGAVPIAGAGMRGAWNKIKNNKAIVDMASMAPSADKLRSMSSGLYKEVDDMGVRVRPESFKEAGDDILEYLRDRGLDEGSTALTPAGNRLAEIIKGFPDEHPSGVPLNEIEKLRRRAGIVAKNAADGESALGVATVQKIDDFVASLDDTKLTTNAPAGDVAEKLSEARSLWKRMRKSEDISKMIENAEGYLGGMTSGLKNQFGAILRNADKRKLYTADELKLMRRAVHGGGLDFLVRQVGRLGVAMQGQGSNSVGGLIGGLAGSGAGAAVGGPLGAVIGGLGSTALTTGARALGDRNAARSADFLKALAASGGKIPTPGLTKTDTGINLLERLLQGGAMTIPAR